MSSMADQMAARMREEGVDPSSETITPGAAVDPGTGGPPPTPPAPPAEALTTDTQASDQEVGPVPYSRFREVNEGYQKLRGYETLMEYGYDPDSLSRLANFEANYVQDPGGTVMLLVDNLDLPDESKDQIRGLLDVEYEESSTPAGGGTPSTPSATDESEEVPNWFKPYAERQQREDQERVATEENAQRQALLDQVLQAWDAADQQAGIRGPREGVKLALIASHAASNRYQDAQSLAQGARAEWIAEREDAVGAHYVPPGSVTGPRSVPGSTAVPSPPEHFGGDIKKASRAAMAAMERGELRKPGG